jgi:excisionase family DNA binding protein
MRNERKTKGRRSLSPRDALTVEDMADQPTISKSGVCALIQAQRIGFRKVGRRIRFTEAQLRDDIRSVNREKGAGSRGLPDENLRLPGLQGRSITG